MHNSKINIILFCFGFILLAASCKKKDDPVIVTPPVTTTNGTIGFEFSNYVGNDELVMKTGNYTSPSGEAFTVTTFNYYISNIHVMKTDGTEYVEPESYHLVQSGLASSKHFHLKDVPAGTYTGVSFLIGVDSARNVSGAQTGALDQANGMFWTWSTGYIMAKLEGTSPVSTATGNSFTWHIGGFTGPYTGVRKVTLSFPTNMPLTGNSEGTIEMKADVMKWFAPNNVSIASHTEIMSLNTSSQMLANNYANMFSITKVLVTIE